MRQLTIYRYYFTNTDCYKKNIKTTPKGIQVHSTGAANSYLKRYVGPDDGRLGSNSNNNHHNKPGLTVCASAYIGRLNDGTPAIYQTLPWEQRCWLSGAGPNGNANKLGYIGFEICEDKKDDKTYFNQVVMELSVNLVAYLCQEYNIPINKVRDHRELHDMGLASNHADIQHWSKLFGVTMDDYRAAVQRAMKESVKVTYIDAIKSDTQKEVKTIKKDDLQDIQSILTDMNKTLDKAIQHLTNQ